MTTVVTIEEQDIKQLICDQLRAEGKKPKESTFKLNVRPGCNDQRDYEAPSAYVTIDLE